MTSLLLPLLLTLQPTAEPSAPTPNRADEPRADAFDLAKSAAFLDAVATDWTTKRKCGTCHTNYPYLLARPYLGGDLTGRNQVRVFFENRISNWDNAKPGSKPRWDTEVVATAATLALDDAMHAKKLHPLTRQALDRMWKLQQKNGAWNWLKCNWPPQEHDDYFGAVYAAVAVGHAPDGYAASESARAGLAKLVGYLHQTKVPSLHHGLFLVWAAQKLPNLVTADAQAALLKELRAKQREDGGWSLPSLGDWKGFDGRENNLQAGSDAYATGLAVYVLRQTGVPKTDPSLQKAIAWLKADQRASGRWFVPSLNTDTHHYITNVGTAYAVLALSSCE